MATLQDILSGNFPAARRFAEGYAQMPSYLQDPYLGLSTSQVGNVTKGLLSKTQFEKAQEIASKNAETLLGLPKGNTAMDRAKAMGFNIDEPLYHGTQHDISAFDLSKTGKNFPISRGIHLSSSPAEAGTYAQNLNNSLYDNLIDVNGYFTAENSNVLPLLLKEGKNQHNVLTDIIPRMEADNILGKAFAKKNADVIKIEPKYPLKNYNASGSRWNPIKGWEEYPFASSEQEMLNNPDKFLAPKDARYNWSKPNEEYIRYGKNYIVNDPSLIRSTFAAFDPARANEPDLLAALMAIPVNGLLEQPKDKKKKK
ncbi:MAG: hypothetical protein ACO3UU_09600 [Minisyncoccia bacterium]